MSNLRVKIILPQCQMFNLDRVSNASLSVWHHPRRDLEGARRKVPMKIRNQKEFAYMSQGAVKIEKMSWWYKSIDCTPFIFLYFQVPMPRSRFPASTPLSPPMSGDFRSEAKTETFSIQSKEILINKFYSPTEYTVCFISI